MHLLMILGVLALCWFVRQERSTKKGLWSVRWQRTLTSFLLPPCLLMTTALAILWMGSGGATFSFWDGNLTYGLAWGFLFFSAIQGLRLAWSGIKFLRQVQTYSLVEVQGISCRRLDTAAPFIAQVGFWNPQLLVSQGLLDSLDQEHLEAVLSHEQAHHYYRDTFWFFWLGWLRRATYWLPNTQSLWEELLALRELRADSWAAQQVDVFALAESLVLVVNPGSPPMQSELLCAGIAAQSPSRLEERIEALLAGPDSSTSFSLGFFLWLSLMLIPFAALPFHTHCVCPFLKSGLF
jgi:Peptidase family M48